ncbi:MAG: hypothetical protein MI924_17465 [Chloroflexales bacterium]|nr:hypothetical protein [Chloroflexales bacterium]
MKEGQAALLAGDAIEARQRFRRALELDAQNVEALIGMAGAVRPYREKQEYLQQALQIDPANAEAQASLTYVENKLASGEVLAPRGVSVAEPTHLQLERMEQVAEPSNPIAPAVDTEYCYIHPDRETGLRCTNCDRPICHECVRPAVVGQLCPECAHARRPRNYQVSAGNLAVAFTVSFIASLLICFLAVLILRGFFAFIIAFILAPLVAEFIVRILDRLTHAKRGREMQITVGIGLGFGAAPWILLPLLIGGLGFGALPSLLFVGIAIATAVARLR